MAWYNPVSWVESAYDKGKDLLSGYVSTPNTYDANKELEYTRKKTEQLFNEAEGQRTNIGINAAPGSGADDLSSIEAERIAAPERLSVDTIATPESISAQTIGAPSTLTGPEAEALKQRQLDAAAALTGGPSAAAGAMKAGLSAASRQMLGQAAAARGSSRAAAARSAMLGTGELGMQAVQNAASMAAAEELAKKQAAVSALSGIRAGDVTSAAALTDIGRANQAADIERQRLTEANKLTASARNQEARLEAGKTNVMSTLEQQKANQTAGIQAQQATFGNRLAGWTTQQGALNQATETALQTVGAQTQAAGVASGYGAAQDAAKLKNKDMLSGLAGAGLGALMSDESAKLEISPLSSDRYKGALSDGLSLKSPEVKIGDEDKGQDFLKSEPAKFAMPKEGEGASMLGASLGKGLKSLLGSSDERVKREVSTVTGSPLFDDFEERTRGMPKKDAESLLSSYENLAQSPTMPASPHNRTWADFRGMNRDKDYETLMDRYTGLKRAEEKARESVAMLSDETAKRDISPAKKWDDSDPEILGRGNIPLNERPSILNPDGSRSSVYSMSFGEKGKEVLIPGVRHGLNRQMTEDEAIEYYRKTGEYLGKFDSVKEADAYANKLHEDQASIYPEELEEALSDETAKREVDRMGDDDLIGFAEDVPMATYRFKEGVEDNGEDYHAGTLAGALQQTGPLGRLMVHRRGDGLKQVEYGPLGLAVGKGALAKANRAEEIALQALEIARGRKRKAG